MGRFGEVGPKSESVGVFPQCWFLGTGFSVTKSATLVAQHWEVFIHNVLPKRAYFDMFRQRVGYVNLDTDSSVSPPNGGTRNGIYF